MRSVYSILSIMVIINLNISHAEDSYNPAPQTWVIDAETVPCENSSDECLLVKTSGKREFEIFNNTIEGFTYEKGSIYTIIVKQELKQPPIAVGESLFKYVFVKLVSKKTVVNNISATSSPAVVTGSKQKIFEINFETVPCESDQSKSCLLVKEKGKTTFEILDAVIYGFNFQPGYAYTIVVKETANGNYYFVNEINKRFVAQTSTTYLPVSNTVANETNNNVKNSTGKIIQPSSIQASAAIDGKWYLRKMKESEGSSFVTDDNVMWIQINSFNDRIDGFGACNKFAAVLRSDLTTTFDLSKLTTNYALCGNKKLEDLFYDLLQKANRFEIRNGNLILSDQWKFLLGFTSNPDDKEDITTTYTPSNIVKNDEKIYATNLPQTSTKNDTYQPPVIISETSETSNSSSVNSSQKASSASLMADPVLEAKNKEIEELRQQLAQQKQAEEKKKMEVEKEMARQAELEKQKLAKQEEIEELKKQLAAKESQILPEQKNNTDKKAVETSKKPTEIQEEVSEQDISDMSENGDKKKIISDYTITKFTVNKTNNIPEPEFPLRPYYLDGNELTKLERAEANFAIKQKGIYRGQDKQVQIMKEESPIQFIKGNLPRFFISIDDPDIDPYDVIDLCRADRIGKGRRNFTYAGTKYGGRVKDVTGKLVHLEFKKIRKGLYEIIVEDELKQGEYAFLPLFNNSQSLSSTNSIKANCFGIVDPDK